MPQTQNHSAEPRVPSPQDNNTEVSSALAMGSHVDLFLLVYLYLRRPELNTDLKPTVFNVGQILRRMSAHFQTPYLEKLRRAAIDQKFTLKDDNKSSVTHRALTTFALARLSSLGFLDPVKNKPTVPGLSVIKAIRRCANDVREHQGIKITGNFSENISILIKDDVVSIVDVETDTEVARFTAPEELPKRTAPENRKNPHAMNTKHSKDFMDAVSQGMKKTGLPKRELVEAAVYEYLERKGVSIDDSIS